MVEGIFDNDTETSLICLMNALKKGDASYHVLRGDGKM
jgi:hypothetical protein